MATFTNAQLQQLWLQAGGAPALAPTMAAIALAESGGNSNALNPEDCRPNLTDCLPCSISNSGDYSIGLWQINYFGSLFYQRKAAFGCPAGLFDPLANARAAKVIAGTGSGLTNWTTYKDGTYKDFLRGSAVLPGLQGPTAPTPHRVNVGAPTGPSGPPSGDDQHLTAAWKHLVSAIRETMQHRANLSNQASRGYKRTVRHLTRR